MTRKHTFSTSGKCTRPSLRFLLLSGCTLYPLGPKTFTQSSVLGLLTSVRAMVDFGCPLDMVDMRSFPPTTAVILFATVRLAHYHRLVIQLIYVLNDVRDTLRLCTHHREKNTERRVFVRFPAIFAAHLLAACSHHTTEKPSRSELTAQNPYNRPRIGSRAQFCTRNWAFSRRTAGCCVVYKRHGRQRTTPANRNHG